VLDRIGQQIGHHLSESVRVDGRFDRPDVVRDHERQDNVIVIAVWLEIQQGLFYQRSYIAATVVERQVPGFELFDIENVVDQAYQALAVLVRDIQQRPRALADLAGHAADQHAPARREWRSAVCAVHG